MPPIPNHKMSPLARVGPALALAALLGMMLATTTAQWRDVFPNGRIFFVDADCYARMTRVQQVIAHPFRSIRHHDFENFPAGIATHTTAPLDWLIAALATAIAPFSPRSLDLAGAWISPLLGLATLVGLWAWSARERLPFRHAMLLLLSVSPIVTQAFRLGRPDHQSLLLLLLAAGLAAEWTLWRRPGRRAALAWGLAWGLALWTSLYEPLVVFGLLLLARSALLRRAAFTRIWGLGWAVVAAIFGASVLLDGWRVSRPDPTVAAYFENWSRSIAELASLPPLSPQFLGWLGWLAPVLPVLLARRFWTARDPRALGLLTLLLATYALTCWQIRWGCFLALTTAMALPWALAAIPSRPLAWTAFLLSLFPLASQWDALLYPDEPLRAARAEQRIDTAQLQDVAAALVSNDRTGILAPWWLSPPLAYWSGQPCVAGSSHESLPGIVDTARFYLTTDATVSREILERRNVRYVIAYEPDRVLSTASTLLNTRPLPNALGATLYRFPNLAPPFLKPVFTTEFFRVYERLPASSPVRESRKSPGDL